jgi:hypothetical protein
MASIPEDAILDRASAIFNAQLKEMKNLNLTLQRKLWYEDATISQFRKFSQLLTLITTLMDRCDEEKNTWKGAPLLNKKQVHNLYSFLYNKLVSSIIWLSPAVPTETDKYARSLIVSVFFTIATCLLFLKDYWPLPPDDVYYKKQTEIPYVVDFKLGVSTTARICDFSMEELITSMDQIELRLYGLQYHPDLVEYVDALEIRVCEFYLYLYDKNVHNVKNNCVKVEPGEYDRKNNKIKPGKYGCTSSAEYELANKILSIRQTLTWSLTCLRTHDYTQHSLQDLHLAQKIHAALLVVCGNIYGDTIPEKFYNQYTEWIVSLSEGHAYFFLNGPNVRLDAPGIIRQFRKVQHWSIISSTANRPLLEFMETPQNNYLAFKVLFKLLMELVFRQTLEENYLEYYHSASDIHRYPQSKIEAMKETSKKNPLIIDSFNEACVMTGGDMYVFGKEPEDWFVAFAFWMEIVASKHAYKLKESILIYPLISLMLEKEPDMRVQSDEIIGSSISMKLMEVLHLRGCDDGDEEGDEEEDPRGPLSAPRQPSLSGFITTATPKYFLNIFDNRVEMLRAEMKIRDVLSDPTAREMDSSYFIDDGEEMGIPTSGKSGWV